MANRVLIFPSGKPTEARAYREWTDAATPGWQVTTGANVSAIGVGSFT